MSALLSFAGFLAPRARPLLLAALLAIVTVLAGAALFGVSGWFLTAAALAGSGAAFNIFTPSALVRGLSLIRIASRYGERVTGHDATLRLLADLRTWLFATLFPKLPLDRESPRHGDMVGRMTADVDALSNAFLVVVSPLFAALAVGAVMAAILASLLPSAMPAYAVLYALAAIAVPVVLVAVQRRAGKAIADLAGDLRMATFDAVEGHADLVAMGATGRTRMAFAGIADGMAAGKRRLAFANAVAAAAINLLGGAVLLLVLWHGLTAFRSGDIAAPVLVGLLLAAAGSFEAPQALARGLARFTLAAAGAERIRAMADRPPRIMDPAVPAPPPVMHDLAFEAVSFGYGPHGNVLDGFDLHVRPGEHIALVGPSGAGKSTLLQLAARLYDPQAGRVAIGGRDLRAIRQSDAHRLVTLLEQTAPVFNGTVAANLRIASPDADDAALWRALADARLADTVRTMPRGLATMLGETGHVFSVGQARRLCLARALLSAAPILLLDEPTSGLDRDAELSFLGDLSRAAAGRTVLLATHAALPPGVVTRTIAMREPGQ